MWSRDNLDQNSGLEKAKIVDQAAFSAPAPPEAELCKLADASTEAELSELAGASTEPGL